MGWFSKKNLACLLVAGGVLMAVGTGCSKNPDDPTAGCNRGHGFFGFVDDGEAVDTGPGGEGRVVPDESADDDSDSGSDTSEESDRIGAGGQGTDAARPKNANLPESCMLEVQNILQMPQLPNGCEGTALAIVLNHLGYPADKSAIALDYIPRAEFVWAEGDALSIGPNPEDAYPGSPTDGTGYYCFPGPVVAAANSILQENGAPLVAADLSGFEEADLCRMLAGGLPVILWTTTDGLPPVQREDLAWRLNGSGNIYVPYGNLHTVVLCGYDEENFYVCDPLGLVDAVPRAEMMALYRQVGMRAVAVGPKG